MNHATYLCALLVWVLPPIAFQWAMGRHILWSNRGPITTAVVLATAWLVAADNIAIGAGIWVFSPATILGPRLENVPIEEALFFLCTNLLVAQSIVLWGPRHSEADDDVLTPRSPTKAPTE